MLPNSRSGCLGKDVRAGLQIPFAPVLEPLLVPASSAGQEPGGCPRRGEGIDFTLEMQHEGNKWLVQLPQKKN